uniref:Ribosomal protein S12 n=1 Tax=Montagnia macrospora TaxID=2662032 RepID=A0A343UXS8_9FLOR|nr:ribosomal protein S12 [Montagnia macrospora]AVK39485.1 ribosomal protein S12 [Montagnia macrospora]
MLMVTLKQLAKTARLKIKISKKSLILSGCPQKKGICLKVYSVSPKKPNSAVRKIAKVKLSSGKIIIGYIPGEKHTLQEHSMVLVRGGRVKDLPGVHYHLIRGVYDLGPVVTRATARSKYGKSKT